MRVIFMGTPDFAVPCLERLLADGHEVVGVFTQPDKPKGRGKTVQAPPVKELAEKHGIPVFQPVKMRDGTAAELFRSLQPEIAVVVAYGRILPKEMLEIPKYGCINIHGSLLPKYRGAAPIQWSVLNGDPVTGVTAMYLAEGMDTGDMIFKMETPIGPEETAGELFDRLAPLGAECLSRTMKLIEAGEAVRTPQEESEATMAPMLEKSMGQLDFSQPAEKLHNLIRGMNPWPSAYLTFGGKLLKVHQSRLTAGTGRPGEILDAKKLVVACGEGALELTEVQPEGKGRMAGGAFCNGARLKNGDFLQET